MYRTVVVAVKQDNDTLNCYQTLLEVLVMEVFVMDDVDVEEPTEHKREITRN